MDDVRDGVAGRSHRQNNRTRHQVSPATLTPLSMRQRFVKSLVRNWPFSRGRTRITNILTRWVSLPSSATFEFDYGVFVDASLANWPNGYRTLFLHGRMDDNELKVWERLLRPGDAVVDCGANYGWWTLVSSRLVGPRGSVFAFEANPPTAERLEQNVRASGAANVKIYKVAVAAERGVAFIHTAKQNPIAGHASLHTHAGWDWDEPTPVEQLAVDGVAFQEQWPVIRLIKLDIEGAELSSLQGMQQLIRRDRPYVTVEWNVSAAGGFGYHPRAIVEYLTDLGYSLAAPCNGGFQAGRQPGEGDVSMMWFVPDAENTADRGVVP